MLSTNQVASFQQIILTYFHTHGRHTLPWRTTHITPYNILVSEIMLQQTQVDRVIPKFLAFLAEFPTVHDLASAQQSTVLRLWSGLGYNRRALNLQRAAQAIVNQHSGVLPNTLAELVALPGIGPYTASAILAFAYNQPVSVIETNIRTVYIHHFFNDQNEVNDNQILPLVTATLDEANPRQWYAALMDYGAHLKSVHGNLSSRSQSYTKQSTFAGSDRQLRGAILKLLTAKSPQPLLSLTKVLKSTYHADQAKVDSILLQLEKENFITTQKTKVNLL